MSTKTRFVLALLIAMWSGYLSLSQEMLWIRSLAFATGGGPRTFAYVLGFFLIGIAFGSLLAERVSAKKRFDPFVLVAAMFACAGLLNQILLPWSAEALVLFAGGGFNVAYLAVALTAAALGGVLPLAADGGRPQGLPEAQVGRYVSWIYVANIVGSTAGPLITGFVLFDRYTLVDVQTVLTIGALVPAALIAAVTLKGSMRIAAPAVLAAAVASLVVLHQSDASELLHKLQFKDLHAEHQPYKHLVENRSGIIGSIPEAGKPDALYGGGAYDGRFNIDPNVSGNGILRAYIVAALHPQPTTALEIGMAGAAWTRVLADYDVIKTLDVVEINPGYPKLIRHYPEIAPVLSNPKVTIHDDDGRRWLKNNPDKRFDFVLMNTTHNWRSNITALVSREFLQLIKAHLNPGGVLYYNTTGSLDIVQTAKAEFKHVVFYERFIAASDTPFNLTEAERRANLKRFVRDGAPVFKDDDQVLDDLATVPLRVPTAEEMARAKVVTDDNMLTEYRREIYDPRLTWANLFAAVK